MLLNLLKRDLRLHWDALVIPIVLLVLVMGAIGLSDQGTALVGLILCAFLFVPVLPIALQIREAHMGTMSDLLALPVSRGSVVTLRYLEVLLFATGLLLLAHLGTWIALSAAAHKLVPFDVMGREGALAIGLLLLFLFAYPMPFAFRWGGKGAGAAFSLLFVGFTGLQLTAEFSPKIGERFGRALVRFLEHMLGEPGQHNGSGHPGQMALLLLGLFSLSYVLSLKAFARRDF